MYRIKINGLLQLDLKENGILLRGQEAMGFISQRTRRKGRGDNEIWHAKIGMRYGKVVRKLKHSNRIKVY